MERFFATVSDEVYEVTIDGSGTITVNGSRPKLEYRKMSPSVHGVVLEGRSMRIAAHGHGSRYTLIVDGKTLPVSVESSRERLLREHSTDASRTAGLLEVRAPMPALVVAVEVAVGEVVHSGQGLLLLEAMKMENEIKAHTEGTIAEIFVKKGDPVEKGELLLRFR